jgi:hypothetical protein
MWLISISKAFSGPPGTGNGGYVCGSLAALIDGPAEITLKMPCPLDTALDVVEHDHQFSLMDGENEIAVGRAALPDIKARDAISFDQAVAASRDFSGYHHHPFPGCFVCGTDLAEGVGLRIYAGPIQGEDNVVGAPWIPHANHTNADGIIEDKIIWSALDCPGAFTVMNQESGPMLLGRLNAHIFGRPEVGEACVVQGWKTNQDGRKIMVGTALYGGDAELLAVAKATWITVKNS